MIPLWLDLSAVALGAIQGAVFATRIAPERHFDILGVCTIGVVTGIGGGILRDELLDVLPVAMRTNSYLVTAVIAALAGMLLGHLLNKVELVVVALDALSLGLFVVLGVSKAIRLEIAPVPAILVGLVSAIGGSIIRDVMMRTEIAVVQVGSFYATAVIGGAITFVLMDHYFDVAVASLIGIIVTFSLRMLSVWFGWTVPRPRPLRLELRTARRRGEGGIQHLE